jgi:hypothetical protein
VRAVNESWTRQNAVAVEHQGSIRYEWKEALDLPHNQALKQHSQIKCITPGNVTQDERTWLRGSSEGCSIYRAQSVFDLEALIPLKVIHQ